MRPMNIASHGHAPLKVAIAGLGAIGLPVARRLDDGIEGLRLTAVSAGNLKRAHDRVADFTRPPLVCPLSELAVHGDVIIEAAPASLFAEIADIAIDAGRIFMPLSVGQLIFHPDLEVRAKASGARIIAPTGALLGLDAVRAAAEGTLHSVRIVTRKPPQSLKGAPRIEELGLDMDSVSEPINVYKGNARGAIKGFPANVNVAVALSLAGNGPDNTEVEIWADPNVERNTHTIYVDADSTRFQMTIEGIPSPGNPATGLLTPLSVIAALRGLVSTLKIGS